MYKNLINRTGGKNMNIFGKLLSVVIIVSLALLLITGCSSGSKTPETSTPAESATTTETTPAETAPAETTKAPEDPKPTYVFKWAEVNAENHIMTYSAQEFARALEEESGGRMKVDIYPAMALGDEKTSMQSLQMGVIDFFRGSALTIGDFGAKKMGLFGLPYIFRDRDHLWKVLQSEIGKSLLADVQESGSKMVAIGYFEEGARHFFFTKKDVVGLADMKGLKIRVPQTELMMDTVKAFGANPTPISYSELYSALQTNIVDGAENPVVGYLGNSFYEVAGHLTFGGYSYTPCPILVSEITWNKLSEEDKNIVLKAASIAEEWNKSQAQKNDDEALATLKEKGVKISDANVEEWQAAVKPVYEKYGKDYLDIIEQIAAVK